MPKWSPCKRQDFIRRLRQLGFEGVFSGAKHQFMVIGQNRLTLPSNAEYSVPQLRMMLREVGAMLGREITLDEWSGLS
jgi:hypothetical protein